MITVLMDPGIGKVLSLFALSKGSRFNRNELKEKTRLNNLPLDNSLMKLINAGVLARKGNYYSLNLMEENGKKIVEMLSMQYKYLKELPMDAYFAIYDTVNSLSVFRGIEAYLFGSYSKLVFKPGSDIDIAVLSERNIRPDTSRTEKRYGKNIEVHLFSRKDFHRNRKDPLVREILKNGVRLI